jgi:hypothetical protein
MRSRLTADGNAFGGLIEVIVMSPQFLNKRGRDKLQGHQDKSQLHDSSQERRDPFRSAR